MTDDQTILREYKEAFRKYAKDGIIDLDNRLKYKFDFQIHRLEGVLKELNRNIPPSRQSQYFITLVKSGSGQKSIGHFNFPIKNNTLILIPKRVMHSSTYWSTRCSGYVLSFNVDFFLQNAFPRKHIVGKKIFKASLKPYLNLSKEQAAKLSTIFEFIISEYREGKNAKNEMIAVKILELMIQCDRLYTEALTQGDKHIYDESFERFNELIDKHFTEERSVAYYANALHIHPHHLNFLSKKLTGQSAKETINNRILMEAKYLLSSTRLTVKEIAYKLGFQNPEYFHVFFRKEVQMTPAKYRAQF